jgi:hypothetical protein
LKKKTTNYQLPEELHTLSEIFIKSTGENIYENLSKIWILIGDEFLKEIAYKTLSDNTKEEMKKLHQLNILAKKEIGNTYRNLPKYTKGLESTRAFFHFEIAMENSLSSFKETDLAYSFTLESNLRFILEKYIELNNLKTEYHSPFTKTFMKGITDSHDEEYPPYTFCWNSKFKSIRGYLNLIKRISRRETLIAWYNYEFLKNICQIYTEQPLTAKFPVSYFDKIFKSFTLLDSEKSSIGTLLEYSEEKIKTSWLILYKSLKDQSQEEITLYIDVKNSLIRVGTGKILSYSPNSDEFVILKALSESESPIKYTETSLTSVDSDSINESIKNIRRRLKLTKLQLRNKDGYASFVGVKIVKMSPL